jgi:hypothetical protein
MPRIRTIKPEFWASEQIGECSPNARLLFIGLWNYADDYGVYPDKPKELKAKLFPYDDATTSEVRGWIDELVKVALLRRFDASGATYLYVTGWEKHQRIDKRNEDKRHPDPIKFLEHSPMLPGMIQDGSRKKSLEGKGKEGRGRESTGSESKRGERKERESEGKKTEGNGHDRKEAARGSPASRAPSLPRSDAPVGRATARGPDRVQQLTQPVLAHYGPDKGLALLEAYRTGDAAARRELDDFLPAVAQ